MLLNSAPFLRQAILPATAICPWQFPLAMYATPAKPDEAVPAKKSSKIVQPDQGSEPKRAASSRKIFVSEGTNYKDIMKDSFAQWNALSKTEQEDYLKQEKEAAKIRKAKKSSQLATSGNANKPKRLPSAFSLFAGDFVRQKMGTFQNAGALWNKLPEESKAEFVQRAEDAKAKILKEREESKAAQQLTETDAAANTEKDREESKAARQLTETDAATEPLKDRKESKASKQLTGKPTNPYAAYVKENFSKVQSQTGGSRTDVMKKVAEQYRSLPQEQKEQMKQEYATAKAAWAARQPLDAKQSQ